MTNFGGSFRNTSEGHTLTILAFAVVLPVVNYTTGRKWTVGISSPVTIRQLNSMSRIARHSAVNATASLVVDSMNLAVG